MSAVDPGVVVVGREVEHNKQLVRRKGLRDVSVAGRRHLLQEGGTDLLRKAGVRDIRPQMDPAEHWRKPSAPRGAGSQLAEGRGGGSRSEAESRG